MIPNKTLSFYVGRLFLYELINNVNFIDQLSFLGVLLFYVALFGHHLPPSL